jgi:hypothetical protein
MTLSSAGSEDRSALEIGDRVGGGNEENVDVKNDVREMTRSTVDE